MSLPNNYEVEGQLSIFDIYNHDIWSGKTLPEPSAVTKEKTSDVCLKKRQKSRIKTPLFLDLRGGRWTPSGCILGNGWSIAWRVHDAQFWGVPQRRKRIALVADFGGKSAPEILFERKSVSGNSETSRKEGQGTSTAAERDSFETISFQERAGCDGGAKESLSSMSGQEHCQPSTTKVYCLQGNGIDRADTAGCNGKGWREDQSYTLNTIDRPAVCTYQQTTATDSDHIPCVYGLDRASFNQGQNAKYDFSIEEETAQTLVSRGPGGVLSRHAVPYAQEIIKE